MGYRRPHAPHPQRGFEYKDASGLYALQCIFILQHYVSWSVRRGEAIWHRSRLTRG
jgi:hypothetical protein